MSNNIDYKINKYKTKYLSSIDKKKEFIYIAKFLQYKLKLLQNKTGGGITEDITKLIELVNNTNNKLDKLDNFLKIKNILDEHYKIINTICPLDIQIGHQKEHYNELLDVFPYKISDDLNEYVQNRTKEIKSSNIL